MASDAMTGSGLQSQEMEVNGRPQPRSPGKGWFCKGILARMIFNFGFEVNVNCPVIIIIIVIFAEIVILLSCSLIGS